MNRGLNTTQRHFQKYWSSAVTAPCQLLQTLALLMICTSPMGAEESPTATAGANTTFQPTLLNQQDWQRPVAMVNGEPITYAQLAQELIETHGRDHIDIMIKRKIVEQACRQQQIVITQEEVVQELDRRLQNQKISRKQFVETILSRSGLTIQQHLRDDVWPKVALSKLVLDKVQITDEDLQKALEANVGEKADIRLLVVMERSKAMQLWEQVRAVEDVEQRIRLFEELCKIHSTDQATRSTAGRLVVNHHSGRPKFEELAFSLKRGELSAISDTPDQQYMILLGVATIPGNPEITLDSPMKLENGQREITIREYLTYGIYQKKLLQTMGDFFNDLESKAKIQNFLSGDFSLDAIRATAD